MINNYVDLIKTVLQKFSYDFGNIPLICSCNSEANTLELQEHTEDIVCQDSISTTKNSIVLYKSILKVVISRYKLITNIEFSEDNNVFSDSEAYALESEEKPSNLYIR